MSQSSTVSDSQHFHNLYMISVHSSVLPGYTCLRRITLLIFSFSIQKGNTFAHELSASQSCCRGLTPHTEKNWSHSKWALLSSGSAEDNLYLQAATSSQIIILLWSLAMGFRSKEQLYICIWYEGLVWATDQLITEHFSEYTEVSFKDFNFF